MMAQDGDTRVPNFTIRASTSLLDTMVTMTYPGQDCGDKGPSCVGCG
jgi:hypothetical protein